MLPNYKRTYDQIDLIIRALYHKLVLFLRSINSFCYIPDNESEHPVLGWNISLRVLVTIGKRSYGVPSLWGFTSRML